MALRKEDIIHEALLLLNEGGLEGVTLRKLASRLKVQAPALYWHFKNKAVLINEMAEAILHQEFSAGLKLEGEDEWEWLMALFKRLRRAMLNYSDGGRVVAGAHLSLTMADLTEAGISALHQRGVSLRESRLLVLTATHYTFGYVIEEQSPPPEEGLKDWDMEKFSQEHPAMIAAIGEYFGAGNTADDLFADGLQLILGNHEQQR